jgi:hypothetical protein
MRAGLVVISAALVAGTASLAGANCPTGTLPNFVSCNNSNALTHIVNQHCKSLDGKSEFAAHYCNADNLIAACVLATKSPNVAYPDNCYKEGEPGEIVGTLPNTLAPTSCYQVTFQQQGHKMNLKTMYPVDEKKCTQHH